jgi:HEAT repeat protein
VLFRLLHNEALREKLFEAAALAPERFTPDIWLLLGDEWQSTPEHRALARSYIEKSWDGWTPEQKQAGMRVFLVDELVGKGDPALNTLLRRLMNDQELSPEGRQSAAFAISDLRLADVQGAFTLTRPDEADLAIALLPYLPRTVETYDAFKWLLNEKTESRVIVDRLYSTFGGGPEEVVPDLVRRLLSVAPAGEAADMAVVLMNGRTRAEDLLLWRLALEHPSVETRVAAAEALGSLYDADSIRALAKLVDDPDPKVRDAALASLQRIETIEKQKDRWRKFAEGRAPGPSPEEK